MKKILIPILWIALYFNPIHAQIKKGSWMLGGSLGASWQTAPLDAWINLKMGYFATNRLLIGTTVDYQFTDGNPDLIFANQLMSAKIFPFVRYYFTPTHRFKFFNEVEAEWSSDFSKIINSPFPIVDSWSRHNRFWLRNRFGLNYFLSDNIAIEAQLPYILYYKEDSISHFRPQKEYSFPEFTFKPTFKIRLFLNTKKQSAAVLAQKYLKKGNRTYGMQGNISLDSNLYSSFVPNIGYFITDKWLIGSKLWIFVPNKGDISANLGPEIRFYQPISPKMQWLTQASTEICLFGNFKSTYTQIGTGLNRFVSENISIQCLLNGDMFLGNDKLTIQPNLLIGFQYFMNKK
jgi:hypothetical protein